MLHEVALEALLEGAVPVDGDGEADGTALLAIDVVTALDAEKAPAVALDEAQSRKSGTPYLIPVAP